MSFSHAQDLSGANKIVLSYSEHRQVSGIRGHTGAVAPLTQGSNAQDKSMWTAIQGWIKFASDGTNYSSFLDYDLFTANGGALRFTFARICTLAGLANNMFRRAVETDEDDNPIFLGPESEEDYGLIQSGDIVGPWVFEDLQACLSEMRWTLGEVSYKDGSVTYKQAWVIDDWDASVAAVTYRYVNEAVSGTSGWPHAWGGGERNGNPAPGSAAMYSELGRAAQTFVGTPGNNTISVHLMEVWFNAIATGYAGGETYTFDDQGDGVTEGFHKQLSSSVIDAPVVTTLDIGRIGPVDVRTAVPAMVDEPTEPYEWFYLGWGTSGTPSCFVKWDFTYA